MSGWRDMWDEPDDSTELRTRAEVIERRQMHRAKDLGTAWPQEFAGMAGASGLVQRFAGRGRVTSNHDQRSADSIAPSQKRRTSPDSTRPVAARYKRDNNHVTRS